MVKAARVPLNGRGGGTADRAIEGATSLDAAVEGATSLRKRTIEAAVA
jgi:hypothetical protein